MQAFTFWGWTILFGLLSLFIYKFINVCCLNPRYYHILDKNTIDKELDIL